MLELPSSEHMRNVVEGMRETIRARAAAIPDPVNAEAAAAIFEPLPLLWSGVEYHVRQISYLEGLRLSRLMMQFDHFRTLEKPTLEQVSEHTDHLRQIQRLFWSFLTPVPTTNPFLDAAPLEVGELASFFFVCLRIQSRPFRPEAVRPSPSIT